MTPQFSRALVLIEQQRYEQAIGELQLHLGSHAEDAVAHALLSQCHLHLEHYDEAQRNAEQAIALAPDEAIGQRMLAAVLVERKRYPEAERAIQAALAMDPHEPDLYALDAAIQLRLEHWQQAADAANRGLAIDPENIACLNIRAQALVMLGDRAGAAATVQDALRHDPEDPWIHANQGWAELHANQPRKAAEHFREALRLDPEMDWARAGIIEALKARNFLYRGMLQYFLWMSRLPGNVRWGIVIGFYFAQRFLNSAARQNPAFAPYVWPILGVLITFALLTWLASPLCNLLLRLDSFGKHALSEDQRRGANLLGVTLLIAVIAFVGYLAVGSDECLGVALVFGLLSLPVSAIYVASAGWPRNVLFAVTGGLLLMGLSLILPAEILVQIAEPASIRGARTVFFYGILGSQFLANYLMGVEVRR